MKRNIKRSEAADQVRRRVRETVEQYGLLKSGDHIVIGLSGGPDSVCLFFLLLEMAEEYALALHPVHVNHQLRGEAADQDQRYVEELCRERGLSCRVVSQNVKELAQKLGMGTEEAGRLVRYQAFEQEGRRVCPGGGAKIAVAQNRLDQAETVLMRLLRGSGTQGLAGMEPLSKEGIIRPLLFADRQDIEAFCREEGLSPRIDHTNLEPLYRRNRIRLELLPYLRERYNENIVGALTRLASIAAEDRDYFQRQTEEFIRLHVTFLPKSAGNGQVGSAGTQSEETGSEGCNSRNSPPKGAGSGQASLESAWGGQILFESAGISAKEMKELHPALRKRVILELLGRLGLNQDVNAAHLQQAEKLLKAEKTPSQAYFPGGYRMKIQYGQVVFFQENPQKSGSEKEKESCSRQENSLILLSHPDDTGEKIRRNEPTCLNGVSPHSDGAGEKIPAIHLEGVLTGRISGKMMGYESFCRSEREKSKEEEPDVLTGLLDAETLMESLYQQELWFRTRRPGDRIRLPGGRGSKKLQDFFVDKKVPQEERNQMPLLCAGQNVLWIPGLWAGEELRIKEGTQMILLLEYYK